MAERKAVNKYYPPDWDPSKGSVNKHVGQHPLRERARKLSQGILVIRFEMPYNIWCGGCGNHIGMGVRYNAEKKKVGNYYTTPIYRFRMKCHLCDNYIEIETDPKNCDYTIISGARRKEERWDPGATENVQATDHAEKQKLIDDAMYKLEHGERDKRKSKAAIPGLVQIKEIQSPWKDDFALNQILRKKLRQEKKLIIEKDAKDREIKDRGSLDIELVNEDPEDIQLAKKIKFHSTGFEEDQRKRRFQIKARPMFADNASSVTDNRRAKLLQKRQKMLITKPDHGVTLSAFSSDSDSLGIRRRENKVKACIDINVKHGNKKDLAREKDDIAQDYGEDNDRNQTTLNPVQNEKTSSNMFSNTDTSYEKESRLRTALQTFKHEVRKPSTTSTVDRDNDVDKKKCLTAEQDRNREMLRPKISLISENYSDTDSDCSM